MSPTETTAADVHAGSMRLFGIRRAAVYVIAFVALAVAVWALMSGADRDLSTTVTEEALASVRTAIAWGWF